ncbi:MAG: hypothetical protein JW888_00540 [Pirellulales bacterium]|nr:hypothetical protein [Pirellulales bacterium]
MPTIIKASNSCASVRPWTVDLVDLTQRADPDRTSFSNEAARLIATAKQQAEHIRLDAATQGRRTAYEMLTQHNNEQWGTLTSAIEAVVQEIQDAKQAWLNHWEKNAVHVAISIAERLIRRSLDTHPDVPLTLVREALELAVGNDEIRVYLNPTDLQTLGVRVDEIAKELVGLGSVEVVADEGVSPGGCRVNTCFGVIDQQFETQLARIEEELVY